MKTWFRWIRAKLKGKHLCIYGQWNPSAQGVTHVTVQVESNPPYVFKTYRGEPSSKPRRGWSFPDCTMQKPTASDLPTYSVAEANERFDFYPGDIR